MCTNLSNHPLSLRILFPRFYDAIVTDPPYNIKEGAVVTNRVRRKSAPGATLARHAEVSGGSASAPVHSVIEGGGAQQGEGEGCNDTGSAGMVSVWETGAGARAVASANDLVGEVIWSLLSLARYSLKPGGRLCFFLPLRGAEARGDRLPSTLADKLGEIDAHGDQLSLVYMAKQHMTSPNMCRWLLVLQKEKRRAQGGGRYVDVAADRREALAP